MLQRQRRQQRTQSWGARTMPRYQSRQLVSPLIMDELAPCVRFMAAAWLSSWRCCSQRRSAGLRNQAVPGVGARNTCAHRKFLRDFQVIFHALQGRPCHASPCEAKQAGSARATHASAGQVDGNRSGRRERRTQRAPGDTGTSSGCSGAERAPAARGRTGPSPLLPG